LENLETNKDINTIQNILENTNIMFQQMAVLKNLNKLNNNKFEDLNNESKNLEILISEYFNKFEEFKKKEKDIKEILNEFFKIKEKEIFKKNFAIPNIPDDYKKDLVGFKNE